VILVISRFRVANGMEADVARAFCERPHLVDEQPGFLGMEVFTGPQDPAVFHLVTRWTDAESFDEWHHGEQHRLSHQWMPKGLKLDPAFTQLQVLDRLASAGGAPAPEEAVFDDAALLSRFLESAETVCVARCDAQGRIAAVNDAFPRLLGRPADVLIGEPLWGFVAAGEEDRLRARILDGDGARGERFFANFVSSSSVPLTLSCLLQVRPGAVTLVGEPAASLVNAGANLLELNNELAVLARENARKGLELERARADVQRTLDELNATHWHLRKIQEVLPICMKCGKVKTGDASWESVVEYLRKNTLFLSHGYCPDCGALALARAERSMAES
jgi:heme-degrading monooxygenase HmoA